MLNGVKCKKKEICGVLQRFHTFTFIVIITTRFKHDISQFFELLVNFTMPFRRAFYGRITNTCPSDYNFEHCVILAGNAINFDIIFNITAKDRSQYWQQP